MLRGLAFWSSVAVVAAGCSAGGESRESPVDDDVEPVMSDAGSTSSSDSTVEFHGLQVGPRNVWGLGRALWAQPTTGGGHLVLTTTGVYVESVGAVEPDVLDRFESAVQLGPVAASEDGSLLVVSTLSPPAAHFYDLDNNTPKVSYDLPADASVGSVTIDSTTRTVVLDTSVGPFISLDPGSPPQRVFDVQASGTSAVLPGATVVTPIAGSANVIVSRAGAEQVLTLAVPDGATVLDAQSAPNGSAVAVTLGVGDDFNRKDQIVVLDPLTFDQLASIDTGRAIAPTEWTLSNTSVVVANGPQLSSWALDGTPGAEAKLVDTPVVALHPAGDAVVSEHSDGALVQLPPAPTAPHVIDAGGTALQDVGIDAAGLVGTSVDYFGRIATWDPSGSAAPEYDDRFAAGETTDVAISPDGQLVGAASSWGQISLLDQQLASTASFAATDGRAVVGAIAFDPDEELATGLAERLSETVFDDTVTIWDPDTRTPRFSIGGEREEIAGCSSFYSRIRFDHRGTTMAVSSHDYSVLVIDVATGEPLGELPGPSTVLDVAFSPDDTLLVATYDNGLVNVWNTSDLSEAASYQGAAGGYFAIAILPDSATIAATDVAGTIWLVDVMTGAAAESLGTTAFRSSTLELSGDGSLLAAPMADAAIGIWSLSTRQLAATLTGHTSEVTGLAFSPGGDWLASSSRDGTVRTWTIEAIT